MLNLVVYIVTTLAVKDDLSVAVAARGLQLCLDSVSLTRYLYNHEIHFASNSECTRIYTPVTGYARPVACQDSASCSL